MFICVGEVVGMNSYEKDGERKFYAQVVYPSKINGYSGKRAVSCKVSSDYKLGTKVKVADDFRYPQVIENEGKED